jgi:hypothetical protein
MGRDATVQGDGTQVDGHVDPHDDAAPDAHPDAANCYGGGLATICLTTPPSGDYTVSTPTTVATDTQCTQVVAQSGGPELCVIAGIHIDISSTLDATGTRPLVLVATTSLAVEGKIDVSSYRLQSGGTVVGEHVGAGEASGALCGAPTAGGNDANAGAGGGAGGTFGGQGGAGAVGRNGAGGTAGAPATVGPAPTFVRGGCAGTAGGDAGANAGGLPGHGGGAVYLIAGGQIMVSGVITASAQGGYGGKLGSGGGGAGAGGLIGLDAPQIANTGTIFANGGGGGEGGGQTGIGGNGDSALTATTPAAGGTFNTNGGDGGAGSVGTTLTGGPGLTNNNGAGAGGGGAGVIYVFPSTNLGGTVSPPAT